MAHEPGQLPPRQPDNHLVSLGGGSLVNDYGVPEAKITVIPPGVNIRSWFRPITTPAASWPCQDPFRWGEPGAERRPGVVGSLQAITRTGAGRPLNRRERPGHRAAPGHKGCAPTRAGRLSLQRYAAEQCGIEATLFRLRHFLLAHAG